MTYNCERGKSLNDLVVNPSIGLTHHFTKMLHHPTTYFLLLEAGAAASLATGAATYQYIVIQCGQLWSDLVSLISYVVCCGLILSDVVLCSLILCVVVLCCLMWSDVVCCGLM